ncbi:MAG: F0F1 ATP synthase subunit A [Anaerovoracaceae bacterium]
MGLAEELTEKLDIASKVYHLNLGGFDVSIPQSVVVTWGVMLFLVVLSIIFTRRLEVVPKGKQAVFESFMTFIYGLFYDILGERGKRYIPYLITVLLYLGISNMLGLIGIAPPTKDLNVTAGLALMSIVLVQYAGIHQRGVGGWIKHFTHPLALITPMNILELAIRPVSLCMRLFGNVLGAYIVMELIIYCVPAVVPLAASAYFDIFDGILQAYVFCFLTSLFIQESIED